MRQLGKVDSTASDVHIPDGLVVVRILVQVSLQFSAHCTNVPFAERVQVQVVARDDRERALIGPIMQRTSPERMRYQIHTI